jgi:signal transduction histidine kinase
MPFPFRHRILLVLFALGTIPTAVAILGWALTVRATGPGGQSRAALDELGASGRVLIETLDTTRMTVNERRALAEHTRELNSALSRIQRAEASSRFYYAGLTVVILVLGGLVLYASVRLGGHLSRQLSRPIDELVRWTGMIGQGERLPTEEVGRGAPEFAALRSALRRMADEIEAGHDRELEAERLRTFREIARRVAHEMKNPLTPIRLAIAQMGRSNGEGREEALEVLRAESARLEQLAEEFTELGRLPQGPPSEVDLGELATELAKHSVPPEVTCRLDISPNTPRVVGYYDPLRRAFSNVLRNAVEAMGGRGAIDVEVRPDADSNVLVAIRDHGPGVAPDLRDRIFEPYFTSRQEGTGLGLTMVRQTLEAHGGSVSVTETPGGGATFELRLPA